MKVAILTSGGDAPGMNACLSNLTSILEKNEFKIYAVYDSYQGIINNNLKKVKASEFENISHLGGSVLKSLRSSEFRTEKGFNKAIDNLKSNDIDVLIVIGGDGTFRGATEIAKQGIKVIGIPATIDNDLLFTDRSLGFDTAVNNAVDAIDKIRHTMASNSRLCIHEVMGRHCSDIAVYTAVATNAAAAILSEKYDYDVMLGQVKFALKHGEESPSVIVRENILNVSELAKKIQNDLDIEVRANIIGYIQRGGSPTVFDRIYAKQLSYQAVKLIKSKTFNVAIGILDNEMITVPIDRAGKIDNRKNTGLYEYIY